MAAHANSTSMSRRQALVPLAAMVAVASAGIAVAATAEPHPDAALIAAWERLAAAQRGYHVIPQHWSSEAISAEEDRLWAIIEESTDVLLTTPAKTMAGVAARMSFLFAEKVGTTPAENAMIYGHDMEPEDLKEWRDPLFFDLAKNVRALAA